MLSVCVGTGNIPLRFLLTHDLAWNSSD